MSSRILRTCLFAAAIVLLSVGLAHATDAVSLWDGSFSDDSATWGALGGDGTVIPNGSTVMSSKSNTVTISFTGGTGGLLAIQCPAAPSCSWTGGFKAGDALLWSFDSSTFSPSGPLQLDFAAPVAAAGLLVQADAPGPFTADAFVTFSDHTMSKMFSVTSSGDPKFIGIVDTSKVNIAAITFDVVGSGSDHDFAADSLSISTKLVPEPATVLLLGPALLGLLRRRF